jgi:hypothetical protein
MDNEPFDRQNRELAERKLVLGGRSRHDCQTQSGSDCLFDCFSAADAHGVRKSHSVQRECPFTNNPRTGSRFADEERMLGQGRDGYGQFREKRMVRRRDHHELVVAPGLDINLWMRHRSLHERDVHAELEQLSKDAACVRARGLNAHPGVPRVKSAEQRRQHISGDGGARAYPDDASLDASELAKLPLGGPFDSEEL